MIYWSSRRRVAPIFWRHLCILFLSYCSFKMMTLEDCLHWIPCAVFSWTYLCGSWRSWCVWQRSDCKKIPASVFLRVGSPLNAHPPSCLWLIQVTVVSCPVLLIQHAWSGWLCFRCVRCGDRVSCLHRPRHLNISVLVHVVSLPDLQWIMMFPVRLWWRNRYQTSDTWTELSCCVSSSSPYFVCTSFIIRLCLAVCYWLVHIYLLHVSLSPGRELLLTVGGFWYLYLM